jgi:hypothetical protein
MSYYRIRIKFQTISTGDAINKGILSIDWKPEDPTIPMKLARSDIPNLIVV